MKLFNFTGLVLGHHGTTIQRIQRASGAKVEVHDKAGNLNGDHPSPSDPSLHALVLADTAPQLDKAVALLLETLAPLNTSLQAVTVVAGGSAVLHPVPLPEWRDRFEEDRRGEAAADAAAAAAGAGAQREEQPSRAGAEGAPNAWARRNARAAKASPSASPRDAAAHKAAAARPSAPPPPAQAAAAPARSSDAPAVIFAHGLGAIRTASAECLAAAAPADEGLTPMSVSGDAVYDRSDSGGSAASCSTTACAGGPDGGGASSGDGVREFSMWGRWDGMGTGSLYDELRASIAPPGALAAPLHAPLQPAPPHPDARYLGGTPLDPTFHHPNTHPNLH